MGCSSNEGVGSHMSGAGGWGDQGIVQQSGEPSPAVEGDVG